MAETLMAVEINCTTGEVIERPLTKEEIAEREASGKAFEAMRAREEAELAAKAEAKASALVKLTALGLTEEEANAIIG